MAYKPNVASNPALHGGVQRSNEETGMTRLHRRQFLKRFGVSTASLPFLVGLPSLGLASPARPRQRLIVMFSPNGTIPSAYWPDEVGTDFKLKEIMTPLEAFKDRMLILQGVSNKV